MSLLAYFVAAWLLLVGIFGMVRSRNLVHSVVCLSICQSGTYVLLLSVGFRTHALAPVFGNVYSKKTTVVDPVVQAMTLTDIVVSATVTALLLALTIQVAKRFKTVDPDELSAIRG